MAWRKLTHLLMLCTLAVVAFADDRAGAVSYAPAAQQDYVAKVRTYFDTHMAQLPCEPPTMTFPRWEGFPVRRCTYTDVGITTKAYMLNPSAEQLAHWVVTACQDAQASSMDACTKRMERVIQEASSGGIFPVAGYIVEPSGSAGGHGSGALCILFRDGVTIATATWRTSAPVGGKCGPEDENDKPATRAYKFARVASTRRQDYLNAGGQEPVGTEANFDVRWLAVVRRLYQQAWSSERNELISAKAKAEKAAGSFQ